MIQSLVTNLVGVEVEVIEDDVVWRSRNIQQPNNSNFMVTKINYKKVYDQDNGDYIKVEDKFNCILSNENGNTKTISEAEFKLNFSAI